MEKVTIYNIWLESQKKRSSRTYFNFIISQYEKKKKKARLFSKPYRMFLDPVSYCNLKCPFCETGRGEGRKPANFPLTRFKDIMNEIGTYLFELHLYNWGEPLLNKELSEMISYAKKFSVYTIISTNLSIPLSNTDITNLVQSGLDVLTCSIDGASQENYEKYRVGGNFELVMENLEKISNTKKKLSKKTPYILWRFLVFKHNESEIETAKQKAKDLGIDIIFAKPFLKDFVQLESWASTIPEFSENQIVRCDQDSRSESDTIINKNNNKIFKNKNKPCDWLWSGFANNANTSISPCCAIISEKDDFGGMENKVNEIWNNPKFISARKSFSQNKKSNETICHKCPVPDVQNMFQSSDKKIWDLFYKNAPIWQKIFAKYCLKISDNMF